MKPLFLAWNLGGYFEDPDLDKYERLIVGNIVNLVEACRPDFVGIHLQELGGKHKQLQHVGPAIRCLEKAFTAMGYWGSGLFAELSAESDDFTALGTLVFVHESRQKEFKVWNYRTSKFVALPGFSEKYGLAQRFSDFTRHHRITFGPKKTRKGYLVTKWSCAPLEAPIHLVNVHLIADESNLVATMEGFPNAYSIRRLRALHSILEILPDADRESAFLFGDFNFRLDLNNFVPWISALQTKSETFVEDPEPSDTEDLTSHEPQGDISTLARVEKPSLRVHLASLDKRLGVSQRQSYASMMIVSMAGLVQTNEAAAKPKSKPTSVVGKWFKDRCLPMRRKKVQRQRRIMQPHDILDYDELAAMSEAFQEIDLDGNGRVTMDELRQCMQMADVPIPEVDLQAIMRQADADGSGDIDFVEFVAMMTKQRGLDSSMPRQQPRNTGAQKRFSMSAPAMVMEIDGDAALTRLGSKEGEKSPGAASVGLGDAPNGELTRTDSITEKRVKRLTDKSKSLILEDKRFFLRRQHLFSTSSEFRNLIRNFDKELLLFNDCRVELECDGLFEMICDFPPTYPLDEAAESQLSSGLQYSQTRPPAWTDRILMSSAAHEAFERGKLVPPRPRHTSLSTNGKPSVNRAPNPLAHATLAPESRPHILSQRALHKTFLGLPPTARAIPRAFYVAINTGEFVTDHAGVAMSFEMG